MILLCYTLAYGCALIKRIVPIVKEFVELGFHVFDLE